MLQKVVFSSSYGSPCIPFTPERSIPGAGGSFEGVLVPLWCKQGTRNMREWTPERVDWLSYWQPALKQLGTGGLSGVAGVSCKTSLPSVD